MSMTDKELWDHCWENVAKLDQAKVRAAAQMLREQLAPVLDELAERMLENPEGWLGGRPQPCYCVEDGTPPKQNCWVCRGTGTATYPLHFSWGMGVRNLLRTEGFGEDFFGIDNLDDYYVPLVELAVGATVIQTAIGTRSGSVYYVLERDGRYWLSMANVPNPGSGRVEGLWEIDEPDPWPAVIGASLLMPALSTLEHDDPRRIPGGGKFTSVVDWFEQYQHSVFGTEGEN